MIFLSVCFLLIILGVSPSLGYYSVIMVSHCSVYTLKPVHSTVLTVKCIKVAGPTFRRGGVLPEGVLLELGGGNYRAFMPCLAEDWECAIPLSRFIIYLNGFHWRSNFLR